MYTDYAKIDEHNRRMKYLANVLNYLEYIGYHYLIEEFEPLPVALSMMKTVAACHIRELSFRECAIVIFSATMNEQILPITSKMTVN